MDPSFYVVEILYFIHSSRERYRFKFPWTLAFNLKKVSWMKKKRTQEYKKKIKNKVNEDV